MFEQSSIGRTRRAWTVPVSFAGQLVFVAAATIAPLLLVDPPRLAPLASPFVGPQVRRGHPDAGQRGDRITLAPVPNEYKPHTVFAPPGVPHHAPDAWVDAPPEVAANSGGGYPGPAGLPNGIENGMELRPDQRVGTPPPPIEARRAEPAHAARPAKPPLHVGGDVQESRILYRLLPVYPPLAIRNRVSGVVRLTAIIGADGRVRELRVAGGHPWLAQAAVEAVRQWTYRPALLNGVPVEVDTEITVNFSLSER